MSAKKRDSVAGHPVQIIKPIEGMKGPSRDWVFQQLAERIITGKKFAPDWEFNPVDVEKFIRHEYYLGLGSPYDCHVQDVVKIFGDDPLNPDYSRAIFIEGIGCVAGDTDIYDITGKWLGKIGNLVGSEILFMKPDDTYIVGHVVQSGIKNIRKYRFARSGIIGITDNHLVVADWIHGPVWKHIGKLKEGDKIACIDNGNLDNISWDILLSKDISTTQEEAYDVVGTEWFNGNGLLLHNSGKSYKMSMIACYSAYILLCLRNPCETLHIEKGSKIAIANVSLNKKNAMKVVFGEIGNKINSSPWFREHYPPNPMIQSELQFDIQPDDTEMLNEYINKGKIFKNIYIIPGTSTIASVVGYNIYTAIIDEANLFRTTDNKNYVDEIESALSQRITSRFQNHGLLVMGSSPFYENDHLETKLKEKNRDPDNNKHVYAVRRATWEAKGNILKKEGWNGESTFCFDPSSFSILSNDELNSEIEKTNQEYPDHLIFVPDIEMYRRDFNANPAKALRDLGAIPTSAVHPYFEKPSLVEEYANHDRENPQTITGALKKWFNPIDDCSHAIHVDLAVTGEGGDCGLALGHVYDIVGNKPHIWIDLIMVIKPPEGGRLRLQSIREIIFTLHSMGFNLGLVTYDGFQSEDSQQIISDKGIPAKYLSVDRNKGPYTDFKELLLEQRLNYYVHNEFIRQAMNLEETPKKIDHPPKGKKDATDAVAGVVHTLLSHSSWWTTSNNDEINVRIF